MDAKELMIGDWIFDTIRQKSVRVDCLSYAGIRGEEDVVYYRDDVYEPIPLVPEILEKNGFVKFIAGQYILPREDNEWLVNIAPDISELPNSNGTMLVAIKNVYTDAKIAISYVHQLQHALKLCGIDKEITL